MRTARSPARRVPPKDCGLTRLSTGERIHQPDPNGNRAERRLAAKRKGELGKRKSPDPPAEQPAT